MTSNINQLSQIQHQQFKNTGTINANINSSNIDANQYHHWLQKQTKQSTHDNNTALTSLPSDFLQINVQKWNNIHSSPLPPQNTVNHAAILRVEGQTNRNKQTAAEICSNRGSQQLLNTNSQKRKQVSSAMPSPSEYCEPHSNSEGVEGQTNKLTCKPPCPTEYHNPCNNSEGAAGWHSQRNHPTMLPKSQIGSDTNHSNSSPIHQILHKFSVCWMVAPPSTPNIILTAASDKHSEGARWGIQTHQRKQIPCPQKARLAGSRTNFFPIAWTSNRLIDLITSPHQMVEHPMK